MMSRAERTLFGEWWWTVDRSILFCIGILMLCSIVFGMAASPAVAERIHVSTFHFVNRQAIYLVPAISLLILTSFLSPRYVRRVALPIFLIGVVLMVGTLFFSADIKGSRRWILGIQPSEFVKPAFVVMAAWAFSEGARRKDLPGGIIAVLLLPLTLTPLVLQPDVGQTMLLATVWGGLFFLAGLHWFWVGGLMAAGSSGLYLAYQFIPHVTARLDRFLADKGTQDTFQIDTALESITSGGWLGKGPGEGTLKRILPDSHTDFIFAVTAEEFGILVCIGLILVFAYIVMRGFWLSRRNEDAFCRLAGAGLTLLFGLQSCINISVNLRLMPPKGMTLPFVSYGGSSLVSLALGMGFLLAVTRKRPRAEIIDPLPSHSLKVAPA